MNISDVYWLEGMWDGGGGGGGAGSGGGGWGVRSPIEYVYLKFEHYMKEYILGLIIVMNYEILYQFFHLLYNKTIVDYLVIVYDVITLDNTSIDLGYRLSNYIGILQWILHHT